MCKGRAGQESVNGSSGRIIIVGALLLIQFIFDNRNTWKLLLSKLTIRFKYNMYNIIMLGSLFKGFHLISLSGLYLLSFQM